MQNFKLFKLGECAHYWKSRTSSCGKALRACAAIMARPPGNVKRERGVWMSSCQGNVCGSVMCLCAYVCRLQTSKWMSERIREIDRQQGERNVRQVPMEVPGVLPYCLTSVFVVHELIHLTRFSHSVPYCACVTNTLHVFATDHVSAWRTRGQRGCWEGRRQWQRIRTLGNGVCTSRECITLTDASPLGHRGEGSAHSLSLPPRGRAWSTATHTQIETVIGYTIHTVMRGQKEAR